MWLQAVYDYAASDERFSPGMQDRIVKGDGGGGGVIFYKKLMCFFGLRPITPRKMFRIFFLLTVSSRGNRHGYAC